MDARAVGWALVLAAGVSLTHVPAAAQSSPTDVVRERNQTVQKVLEAAGDSVSRETREGLKDVINGLMDFRELSRRALGKYWEDRTEEERAEFVKVFRELVRNSSVRKLGIYRADSVVYRPAEVEGDRATVVTIGHKDRRTVEIAYHMHRSGGEWMAYDVVIDGSSTLRTYRDSFYREIDATSYKAMFDRLVEKLEQERGTQT